MYYIGVSHRLLRDHECDNGRGMIDLNAATAEQLDGVAQLTGHGFEIVRYREERGRFDAVRHLEEVPGLARKCDGAETQVSVS
jgi:competence protein ComEA